MSPSSINSEADQYQGPKFDQLPNLRFEDGDVVIKLGDHPGGWLVVHRDLVAKYMPFLAPAVDTRWHRHVPTNHPTSGEEVDVFTIALRWVKQDTWLLDGSVFSMPVIPDPHCVHGTRFDASSLVEGWPYNGWSSGPADSLLPNTATYHRVIFTILYGLPLTLEMFDDTQRCSNRYDRPQTLDKTVQIISAVCAYAEYYGCLPAFAPIMIQLLHAHPTIWQSIAENPDSYAKLAAKLHDRKMCFDALRHLLASGHNFNLEVAAELLNMTLENLKAHFDPILAKQRDVINKLRDDLHRLQLNTYGIRVDGEPHTVFTTFLNAIQFKLKDRSDYAKARERSSFIACSIYGRWFAQQLVGARVYESWNKEKHGATGLFNIACIKLLDAAGSDAPSKLFGYKAPERFGSIFKLGRGYNSDKYIQQELDKLVKQAAGIIEKTFEIRTEVEEVRSADKVTTYRCSEYNAQGTRGFTYLPLDEEDVPWNREHAWDAVPERQVVNVIKISEQWLDTLGMNAVNTPLPVDFWGDQDLKVQQTWDGEDIYVEMPPEANEGVWDEAVWADAEVVQFKDD